MSEQNQLAISPVTAGVIGAGAGAAAGAFIPGMPFRNIKSEYASAQNLLTLEKDQFEKLKPADDAAEEIKNTYDTFVSGRKEIAAAKEADEAKLLTDLDAKFASDTEAEINTVMDAMNFLHTKCVINDAWGKGGEGCLDLANEIVSLCEGKKGTLNFSYLCDDTIENKINFLCLINVNAVS